MIRMRKLWFVVGALAALSSGGAPLTADVNNPKAPKSDAAAIPTPAEVQALSVSPAQVKLKGLDDRLYTVGESGELLYNGVKVVVDGAEVVVKTRSLGPTQR